MTDFTTHLRDYISLRRLDIEQQENEAQYHLNIAARIADDLDLLQRAIDAMEAMSAPRSYQARPARQKFPFLKMLPGDQIFIPNRTARHIGGSICHARKVTGGIFHTQTVYRNAVPGVLVKRVT
jgi:hypothetical protein